MELSKYFSIIDGLKSPRDIVRSQSLERLMQIKDPAAIKELLQLTRNEGDFIKAQFCRFLAQFENDEAVMALTILLVSDSEKVSREAARALDTFMGDVKNTALITMLSRITSGFVTRFAIKSLGRDKVAKAVPYLIDVLSEEDVELKRLAVESLRQIGDPMAIHPLAECLDDKDERTAYLVLLALAELGGYEASRAMRRFLRHKNPNLRRAAVWALSKLNYTRSAMRLIAMLKTDDDENVREEIVKRIAGLSGPMSVDPLLRTSIYDEVNNVRVYAKWSLRSLPLAEKEGPLMALTGDSDEYVRGEALLELGRIGESKFKGVIQDLMKRDKSEHVRTCAERALEILNKSLKKR